MKKIIPLIYLYIFATTLNVHGQAMIYNGTRPFVEEGTTFHVGYYTDKVIFANPGGSGQTLTFDNNQSFLVYGKNCVFVYASINVFVKYNCPELNITEKGTFFFTPNSTQDKQSFFIDMNLSKEGRKCGEKTFKEILPVLNRGDFTIKVVVPEWTTLATTEIKTLCSDRETFLITDYFDAKGEGERFKYYLDIEAGANEIKDYKLNPGTLAFGRHKIIAIGHFSNGECRQTFDFDVLQSQKVNISPFPTALCKTDFPFTIAVTPQGGKWEGNGIQDNGLFSPGAAKVGSNALKYTYDNNNGCLSTKSISISIIDNASAEITNVKPEVCASDHRFQLSAEPSGGTWSGSGIDANGFFDPANANVGVNTIKYTITSTSGCTATATEKITVKGSISITVSNYPKQLCKTDANIFLSANPVGGTWSGTGVGANGEFNPSKATLGLNFLTYTISTPNGCDVKKQISIIVIDNEDIAFGNKPESICQAESPLYLSASPENGTWSGSVVEANGFFDPAKAPEGPNVIKYTYNNPNGCNVTRSITIIVKKAAQINLSSYPQTICGNTSGFQISATPTGGTWGGSPGIATNGYFTPSKADPGVNTLRYTYKNNSGCESIKDIYISIITTNEVSLSTYPSVVCKTDDDFLITANPSGGTWSGTGIDTSGNFYPSKANVGLNHLVYTINEGGCSLTKKIDITVKNSTPITFGTFSKQMCQTDPTIYISANPVGGTWSGKAIDAGGNFNPAQAIVGINRLKYTYNGTNGCDVDQMIDIIVKNSIALQIADYPKEICQYGATVKFATNIIAGKWTGTAIDSTGVFDPAKALPGINKLTFSKLNLGGCNVQETIEVYVKPNKQITVGPFPSTLCQKDPSFRLQTEPQGGTWQGSGVEANGLFTPANANIGNNTYTYTYTNDNECIIIKKININVRSASDITGCLTGSNFLVYPTFFKDKITIDVNLKSVQDVIIEIVDGHTNLVIRKTYKGIVGKNKIVVDETGKLVGGQWYQINIKSIDANGKDKVFKL